MTRSRQRENLVFVHHKRRGEVEIRRADGFSKRPKTPQTPMPQHLHYTAHDHSNFCRCSNSKHHGYSTPIGSDSIYPAANLKMYLDQHCLEASSMASFHDYKEKQQTDWAHKGVSIGNFHYASKQKDVVCRCTKPNNHGQGQVRNPEIVELCAEHYRRNINSMTCSKAQWRLARAVSSGRRTSDSDSFKYDFQSVQNILQASNSPLPSPQSDMAYHRSIPDGSPDIPEKVWVKARPSLWNARRGSEISCSTPLGTAITHPSPLGLWAHPRRRTQSVPLHSTDRASVSTVWSAVKRDAAGVAPEVVLEYPQTSLLSSRVESPKGILISKSHLQYKLVKSPFALHKDYLTNCLDLEDTIAQPTRTGPRCSKRYLAELPAHRIPSERPGCEDLAELPTEFPLSLAVHLPTLRELEGTGSYVDYHRPG
jgi:hypothetical protein